jgi:DeoR/GlpR family transcriptional regulator of sugar metabolism
MIVAVIAAQRRNLILDMLRAEGGVSIRVLAKRLGTSAVTVRRDLDYLDSIGMLSRTHGGAVFGQAARETTFTEKTGQAMAEKAAIGRAAAMLVSDGDVVAIGPGTTTAELARELRPRAGLTVVTNSLPVAQIFVECPEIQVIMTGGTLRASILALVGDAAVNTFRGVHVDWGFLSGNGLVADFGLSTPNMTVADADRAIAASAERVVVLADHTKLGQRSAIQTVPSDRISTLVTDAGSRPDEIEALERAGVGVRVASDGFGQGSGHLDRF